MNNESEELKVLKERNKSLLITQVGDVSKALIHWGFMFGICYYCFDALKEFAGKLSFADLRLLLVSESSQEPKTNIRWVCWIGWFLAFSFLWLAYKEKRLRKKYIDRYTPILKEYEETLHPDRTSSGLTSTGDSHPED